MVFCMPLKCTSCLSVGTHANVMYVIGGFCVGLEAEDTTPRQDQWKE